MSSRPMPLSVDLPVKDMPAAPRLPAIQKTDPRALEVGLQQRLSASDEPGAALGRLGQLVLQLAAIQATDERRFERITLISPQLLVFAADHGVADEGVSAFPQAATLRRVLHMLQGQASVNRLVDLQGFELSVVDAGVATHIRLPDDAPPVVPLQLRKIGYGTRNITLSPAMSRAQAVAGLHAGMDVVRHLPGNVLAIGSVGVAGSACASLILSRLCGVQLSDACGVNAGNGQDEALAQRKLERLFAAASRHRKATAPLDVLAAMGGYEIAMMVGAMLQAASERRVVLVDGFVAGAAALIARCLVPEVDGYLVMAHRSSEPGHRLLLIHLQTQPLLDMELHMGQGMGALLAWPMLLAAQRLLEP
jgi:nicotinate-nucleotide--dimethylbenzimidazole phosphoribosyltransferase